MSLRVHTLPVRQLCEKCWRPDIALLLGALALSALIIVLNSITLEDARRDTLQSVEAGLKSQAIAVAEECDRSFKVIDLLLSAVGERIARIAAGDDDASRAKLGGREIHELLEEKRAGHAQVDAIRLVGRQGRLLNSSAAWPLADEDVRDTEYFRAFAANPRLETFISEPIRDRTTGDVSIHLVRRIKAANGNFIGLLLGAITLEHFERLFQSISLRDGSAVALVRQDSLLMARYPRSDYVGKRIAVAVNLSRERQVTARSIDSPVDRQARIVSARPLASYPLAVAVSQTEEGALRGWRKLADQSTSMAFVRTVFVMLMAWVGARWWRRQRRLTEEVRAQNLRFDTAINNMSQGLCLFDGQQRLIVCNDRYVQMYGLDPARVRPGTTLREIVDLRHEAGCFPAMTQEQYLAWRENAATGNKPSDTIFELRDGRTFEIHYRPMPEGGWVATHDDITEQRKLNVSLEQNVRLLSERTTLLQAIIDNFPGGIGFFDKDLRVMVCNDRAKQILDLPDQLFAGGPPLLEDILRFNALRGEYGPGDVETQVATKLALAKDRTTYHFQRERRDGTVLDVRGIPIANGGFITTYMDVTERHRSEARIAHMARHDALTGLGNRVLFHERLEQVVARSSTGQVVAIHLVDLDQFKAVNDSLGHVVGDKLLRVVADRLGTLMREGDMIARMGGDEFAIIQTNLESPADAASLAHRLIDIVSKPYVVDGHNLVVGASIGIALGPRDGCTPETLIRNADLSLYHAKGNGRGTFSFFEPEMETRMQARHAMESALRNALAAGELELYYQPIVGLDRNEIKGFEALIRWHHPEKGTVSPDEFVPLAEETGLIIPVGEWTIREACATAARWPGGLRVAVNLSPKQFRHAGLPQLILSALAASGLEPERLELEINEMALWEEREVALEILYRLRGLGVRIAMDDFGTGHSSLNYLQSFPFDRIKIDRSFVKDIAEGPGSLKIVRAITTLAHGLGMETTVEGVEDEMQLAAVKSEGCTEIQGYLFSPAVPSREVGRFFPPESHDREEPGRPAAA